MSPISFSANWALFLDVDGTLLDFAGHPQEVECKPELIVTLSSLQRLVPVALISGRTIADLDRLFAPAKFPAAGQHGAERRAASGRIFRLQRPPELSALREALAEFATAHPGLVLEDKGLSVALHYRRTPHLGSQVERLMKTRAQELGEAFMLLAGNMVLEIRPNRVDKGAAIAVFMEEAPFAGRQPVFIGDDVTDEDGFNMVNRLGGHSIKVSGGETVARWRLANVACVCEWLDAYRHWRDQTAPG